MSHPKVAYLAGGKVHLCEDGKARTLDSPFAEKLRDRAVKIDQRHAWKRQGRGAQFMGGAMLWNQVGDGTNVRVAVSGLSRGREPGEVLYTLETQAVAGVFARRPEGEELRLFHGNEKVKFPAARPGHQLIACVVEKDNGTAHLGVMSADGSELKEITEGDSLDLSPCLLPGRPREVVFQTAGLGRDENGYAMGLSPFSLQRLDLVSGEMTPLSEDPSNDLLGPKASGEHVYFIRRPYETGTKISPGKIALDVLLLPFRLVIAFLGYLNFFSARYTGKPLITAGDKRQQGADAKQMMVWGNLIAADQHAKALGDDAPALVPSSWQLCRVPLSGGAPEVLEKGVLAFDVGDDGTVAWSNGSAVFLRDAAKGQSERLCKADRIEQVAVVG